MINTNENIKDASNITLPCNQIEYIQSPPKSKTRLANIAKNIYKITDILYSLLISLLSPWAKATVNSGHIACLIVFKIVVIKLDKVRVVV